MGLRFWNKENKVSNVEPIRSSAPLLKSDDIDFHINSRASLLNAQLRGPINAKGREENLELILITLYSILEDGYKLGYEDGKSKGLTEKSEPSNE